MSRTAAERGTKGAGAPARILIIVQNLPVPFDRRVWLECQALVSAGYRVAVICPKGRDDPSFQVIDSVDIYKYQPYAPGGGSAGFIAEYVYSFLATAWLIAQGATEGTVCGYSGVQPAGHLLAHRRVLPRPRSDQVRLRPSRPMPGALPLPFPRWVATALPRAARTGTQDASDRGSCHLHQRLLPGDRHQRAVARRRMP